MTTITFQDVRAMNVFRHMAEDRQKIARDDDNDVQQVETLEKLLNQIRILTDLSQANPGFPLNFELNEEQEAIAEAARDVLWHSLHLAYDISPDDPKAVEHLLPGQMVIDPDEAPAALQATIILTEREAKIITTLVWNATPDDYEGLTRDEAVGILEKMRHAVFE